MPLLLSLNMMVGVSFDIYFQELVKICFMSMDIAPYCNSVHLCVPILIQMALLTKLLQHTKENIGRNVVLMTTKTNIIQNM